MAKTNRTLSSMFHVPCSKLGEEGVTLIISLVLLASVTFITFALSTLLFREIGASRLLLRSEPAISGANSGGEVALYRLLRGAGNVGVSGNLSQSGAAYQVVPDLYDDPYYFVISASGEISVGLYDAEQPGNHTTGYGSVMISNDSGSNPVRVNVQSWGNGSTNIYSQILGNGQSSQSVTLNDSDRRYIISIQNQSASGNASGNIRAFGSDGQPKGIPSNEPDLQITGSSGNVQRKIQIILQ